MASLTDLDLLIQAVMRMRYSSEEPCTYKTHMARILLPTIDERVKNIIDDCYAQAKKIISEHMDVLEKSSELLLEKEKGNKRRI